MALNAFTSNQGTQTSLLTDNTGGTGGTLIPVMKIDISGQGTAGTIWGGGILGTIAGGTINAATVSALPNIPGGTVNLATVTGNLGTIGTVGLATVSGNVGVSSGTINVSTISTLPNTPGGTINLATVAGNLGTIGTIGLATIAGNIGTIGTIGLATVTGNVGVSSGTINVSTISTLPNIPGGTIGSVVGIGSVNGLSNLPQGSINVTAGTVGGKAASGAAASGNPVFIGGTDSGGTIYGIRTDTNGVVQINGTVSTGGAGTQDVNIAQVAGTTTATAFDVNGGWAVRPNGDTGALADGRSNSPSNLQSSSGNGMSLVNYIYGYNGTTWDRLRSDTTNGLDVDVTRLPNIPGGTIGLITTLSNLSAGSVNIIAGTVNAGTINAGTFRDDGRPARNILTFGTQVTGTAAIAATIIGSTSVGAGTSLWLQDVSITNNNANVLCVLGFGTAQQGTNVLLRHTLGTAGAVGIEKSLTKATNAGMTNQDLVFSLGAAGTVDLTISYFISA